MKSDKEYWQETISRYRVSKLIRLIRRKTKLGLSDIGKLTKKSRQYVNNVQEITIKPSDDFLNKLKEIDGE